MLAPDRSAPQSPTRTARRNSNLRFARVQWRYGESASELIVQVGRKIPQFEEAFLYPGQRGQQDVALAVDLNLAELDGLHYRQQQFGAGTIRLASRLTGIHLLQRRLLLVQSFARLPLQQCQHP